jgi:hypothetical protein
MHCKPVRRPVCSSEAGSLMSAAIYPRHAFNVALGEAHPTLRQLIFRRLFPSLARKGQAVPAAPRTAGAAPALARRRWAAGAEPVLGNGTIAGARARQDAWTAADTAVTGHPATEPAGVLAVAPVRHGAA